MGIAAWRKAVECISGARTHRQTLMACKLAGMCPHRRESALAVQLLWGSTSGLTALMGTVLVRPPTKMNVPVELAVRMLHEMACMPGVTCASNSLGYQALAFLASYTTGQDVAKSSLRNIDACLSV